eukprot:2700109-Rhodomonas_salina.1
MLPDAERRAVCRDVRRVGVGCRASDLRGQSADRDGGVWRCVAWHRVGWAQWQQLLPQHPRAQHLLLPSQLPGQA